MEKMRNLGLILLERFEFFANVLFQYNVQFYNLDNESNNTYVLKIYCL